MVSLNYNHLKYFWFVAHEGNLTRAAEKLHVAQSAVSIQIKTLEAQINHKLFERKGKQLVLTEAGRITLDYADEIFKTANELLDRLKNTGQARREIVRVGVIATLSRNFQMQFLNPLLEMEEIELNIISANIDTLMTMLKSHEIDVVLANDIPTAKIKPNWVAHLISDQPVSLIVKAGESKKTKNLSKLLSEELINLPSHKSKIRHAFDSMLEKLNIQPQIGVEVDDIAMLRLIALNKTGLTLVPSIVVKDELKAKKLVVVREIPEIRESFYAITMKRKFANKLIQACVTNL